MSQTDTFTGNRYQVIAWANRQKIIYYMEFGEYQGEWLMVAKDEKYHIYKDYYGSCSGCDAYEDQIGYSDGLTRQKALDFAKDYPPFVIVPVETMKNLVANGTLKQVFPANVKDSYSDISYDEVVKDTQVAVKIEEGMPVTVEDVLACRNQEIKQRALKHMGYEAFVEQAHPEVLDVDGENQIIKVDDIVFAYVKDSSTPRRYLLRVPPQMTTVKAAIAWTFNMKPEEYNPLIET